MNGKKRDMGLGPLHTTSLSEAREVASECRKLVRDGIDPIERRQERRLAKRAEDAKALTFEQCAAAYIESHKSGWKSAKHANQWSSSLKHYVYPAFGGLPVSTVDTGLVLMVLEPIWNTKAETASRIRGRIERNLDWTAVRNHRKGENPARWRGHLDKTLPKRSKKILHHAALPYEAIGGFMAELRKRTAVSSYVLEFLILTATRTTEVLGAEWSEIDLENAAWSILAERMKAEDIHRVPLSDASIFILQNLPRIDGTDLIFPGVKRGRPLSNMACLNLLKRKGHDDITVHSFRSTFLDWAAEQPSYPREVVERALAHTFMNKVEAAYQRRDLFDKRQQLMDAWAGYCAIDTSQRDNVTPIRKQK